MPTPEVEKLMPHDKLTKDSDIDAVLFYNTNKSGKKMLQLNVYAVA
jgi:hypothetical protein